MQSNFILYRKVTNIYKSIFAMHIYIPSTSKEVLSMLTMTLFKYSESCKKYVKGKFLILFVQSIHYLLYPK